MENKTPYGETCINHEDTRIEKALDENSIVYIERGPTGPKGGRGYYLR